MSISALKVQYASEMLRYQADWNQLTERLERGMGKHGENADQLEKIRLILDYKLKQLVLVERLKELDEQHAKVKSKLQNRRNICRDMSEFTDKLSKASKVEFKKCIFSEEDPGYKFESIITKDKLLIEEICSLFSGKIEYDPLLTRRVFESTRRPSLYVDIDPLPSSMTIGGVTGDSRGAVELIVDDQDCVYLSHFTVECFAKTYSYDPGERRGLDEQIELILKKK